VFTGVLPAFQSVHCSLATLLRHVVGFPDRRLLRGLRPNLDPSADGGPSQEREVQAGSHVHHAPFDGIGVQLFPCSLATATPQLFAVASARTERTPATELPDPLARADTHC